MKTVLFTGGTGAFGKYLGRALTADSSVNSILLVRASSDEEARARAIENCSVSENVEVYAADLNKPDLGLKSERYREIASRVTHVLHAAGSTKFNAPLEDARRHNVTTTQNIVTFARLCPLLIRFGYTGTAMIAGKRIGLVKEDEFEHSEGFNNFYQQAKYEAESLVRTSGLPVVVFRPPFIYAPEESYVEAGSTSFLSVLIKLVARGYLPFVPGTPESTMDIVSEKFATTTLCDLLFKENLSHQTFHISNGSDTPTIGSFHTMIEEVLEKNIPIEYCGLGEEGMGAVRAKLADKPELEMIFKRAESFLCEPAYPKVFDNSHLLQELGISHVAEDPRHLLKTAVQNTLWNSSK